VSLEDDWMWGPLETMVGQMRRRSIGRRLGVTARSTLSKNRPPWNTSSLGRPAPWHQLRFQHIADLRARLADHFLTASAANQTLVAIRELMKAAWKLGIVEGDDHRKVIHVNTLLVTTPRCRERRS
jgi:hypothetical protein